MLAVSVAVTVIVTSCACFGQAATKALSFEVASVKSASAPIATKDDYTAGYNAGMRAGLAGQGMRIKGLSVNITDNTLKDLIRMAYQVKDHQISGPSWMATEKYEIVATMPAGSTRDQAPEMLRTLLQERFHLMLHRETKKMAVYALVPAKSGPKLTPAADTPSGRGGWMSANGPRRVLARSSSLSSFAERLTRAADRPVIDMTGITGLYDFDLTFSPELSVTPTDSGPTLAVALQAQLGLKLEKRDMDIDVMIIDRVDKIPTEN